MSPTHLAPQEAFECVLPRPVDDDEDSPPLEGDANLPLG